MHSPLRIEVPDDAHGDSLRRALHGFDVSIQRVDGKLEVRVDLIDHNPERRVVRALDTIDAWLIAAGLPSVTVHLDGSAYTIAARPR